MAHGAKPKPLCAKEGCALQGQVHERCTGHISANEDPRYGQPCGRWPRRGLNVCPTHGADAPSAIAAAARNVATAEAAAKMATLGVQREGLSPTDALLEEVRWTAGHVAWLRAKVANLQEEDLQFNLAQVTIKQSGGFPGTDKVHSAQPSVWYELYARERAHLVKVCAACAAANVEARYVQIAVDQGQLVSGLLRRVLTGAFDLIVTTLRAAGVADTAIVEVLRQAWVEHLEVVVPRELRALGSEAGRG